MVLEDEIGASSSGTAPRRRVKNVLVQYRMPRARYQQVEDIKKPWTLVCHGGPSHSWTDHCERRNECKACGKTAGQDTARMTERVEPATIFETDLALNMNNKLTKVAKERLAASGPSDGSWSVKLGVAHDDKKRRKRMAIQR